MGSEWKKTFPEKEGLYWFYGYRHGKIRCGHSRDPELILVKVSRAGDGNLLYVANSSFMYRSEVEEPHFKKVDIPKFPMLKGECDE